MLIVFFLAFRWTNILGDSRLTLASLQIFNHDLLKSKWTPLRLNKFLMNTSVPLEATSCLTWYSNNHSEPIIPNFTRNSNLFLTLEGDWWYKSNCVLHALPYGIKGNEAVVKQLLARTKSNMPDEIDRLSCKRCVVIGNGNTLRNSSLGEKINKYDIVIRLNNAPVRGYEKDVGTKTTLRIFYPESATEDPIGENNLDTLFVLVPFKSVDIQWLKAIVYNEAKVTKGFWKNPAFIKNLDPSKVRVLNPFYMHQAVTKLLERPGMIQRRGSHPTTGFLAVTLGLNYCDEVHIAGFGYPFNKKDGLIHYYDHLNMKLMSNSVHNITDEHLCLKKLKNAGVIKYLTELS
ncbi:CMP-N-acetylneuraminate-beta-galactosamide-alpha-2,3-sialyltransferase 4-like isoform X2 [Heterodontus francisci]